MAGNTTTVLFRWAYTIGNKTYQRILRENIQVVAFPAMNTFLICTFDEQGKKEGFTMFGIYGWNNNGKQIVYATNEEKAFAIACNLNSYGFNVNVIFNKQVLYHFDNNGTF